MAEQRRLSQAQRVCERIDTLTAPLEQAEAEEFARFVNTPLDEPFLAELLNGRLPAGDVEERRTRPFEVAALRATSGGELVGTAWMGRRRGRVQNGVIGGVVTAPAFRRQGIATAMCRRLCALFDAGGGALLWLASMSAGARRLYEGLGFRIVAGQLMCRRAAGVEVGEGFVRGAAVTARAAHWGDMASVAPLYGLPHECVCIDAGAPHLSTRVAGTKSCVGLFRHVWRTSVAQGGRWELLVNEYGWAVGSATARRVREAAESPMWLDFVWHPVYQDEGRAFVAEFVARIEGETGRSVELRVCADDAWKESEARLLGYAPKPGRGGALTYEGRRFSLRTWTRQAGR